MYKTESISLFEVTIYIDGFHCRSKQCEQTSAVVWIKRLGVVRWDTDADLNSKGHAFLWPFKGCFKVCFEKNNIPTEPITCLYSQKLLPSSIDCLYLKTTKFT